jgi:tetratricopeptide (TPR) repeat protein
MIVAGWAIDDSAAYDFCEKFYDCLLSGVPFGEATKSARKLIFERYKGRTNTWGAYQCYGDPFYKLDGLGSSQRSSQKFYLLEEIELELYNMIYSLESKNLSNEHALKKLQILEEALKQSNLSSDKILEYKAEVYNKIGDYSRAISLYEKLIRLEKAGYSFRAMEQYCNITCKYWVEEFSRFPKKREEAIKGIEHAILRLNSLLALGATAERFSLLGSAYKRKLMLLKAGSKEEFIQTLENSSKAYFEAAMIADFKTSYPINNGVQLGRIHQLITAKEGVLANPVQP